MSDDKKIHIVEAQFNDVVAKYKHLELSRNSDGRFVISGNLIFTAGYNGEDVSDTFEIEIEIPRNYPAQIPKTKEAGGRIPSDFHTNQDGTLCLNIPLGSKRTFAQNGTLLGYVDDCVIPYLYSFCYHQVHGKMPFGEWAHGGQGILDFYKEEFAVDDDIAVLGLLRVLADNNYRGHIPCPCGSQLKLRKLSLIHI